MQKVFNFPTTFNGMIMTHRISDRITIATDLKFHTITIMRDAEAIDRMYCKGMTLSEYGALLKNKYEAFEGVKNPA